ncbi:TPA: hypothetical protein MJD41_09320 [Klebsiella pneumoniae]|nr:hypothetical protein [Klebsiella pneumoniae]HBZ1403089.1 hypothetical protein [Klebsiella pneumoniae]
MTDITELALRLKLEAHRAVSNFNPQMNIKTRDLKELVEALEKAQTINAAQDDHINQQQDRIDQLEKGHQEAAKQINSWRRMAKQNIAEREKDIAELDAARQRIAELESRTVKLPKLKMLEDYLAEVAIEERKQILVGVKLEFHRACVAAGIKVEAE